MLKYECYSWIGSVNGSFYTNQNNRLIQVRSACHPQTVVVYIVRQIVPHMQNVSDALEELET